MKVPVSILTFLALVLLPGCGYRFGSLMHPQINSIAIAPVTNETVAYNIGPQVRGLLCEAFQQDGSLQLKRESNADCILYARITNVSYSQSTWSSVNDENKYLPVEWRVNITIEYSVVIPGELKPLIATRRTAGSATFMTGADMEAGRMSGVRQAALVAARKIVSEVTEAW